MARGGGDELERQVREALTHLYDPGRLQTHPLTRLLPDGRGRGQAGRALQRELLEGIDALRPAAGAGRPRGGAGRARGHGLLTLRYVEGLDVPVVRARLAVGHAEYFREQTRAIAALASLLRERWGAAGALGAGRSAPVQAASGNLPAELTSLVGREEDAVAVERLLGEHRLVTLTGPGGVGKTRLALRAAAEMGGRFDDGAWLVELAPLGDGAMVAPTALAALGGHEREGTSPREALALHLAGRELLLVLDNCEHLAGACADLVEALLRRCPGLRVLATSREPLACAGEAVWPVPPLPAPPADAPATAADLGAFAAARLFVARARAAASGFTPTDANAAAIARVCALLDGLPLAIELAAARVRTLCVAELAARLDDRLPSGAGRLDLLGGGVRTAPPRHRTLRAVVDWSYDLLDEPEQALFRALAVFAGGCTLAAVEDVCGPDALGPLDGLVSKSLVVPEHDASGPNRYRLLETIRQYAAERLAERAEEAAALRDRHVAHYTALAERGRGRGWVDAAWRRAVQRDYPNVTAALGWCTEKDDAGAAGLHLVVALGAFWTADLRHEEGRSWTSAFLATPAATPELRRLRAEAQINLTWFEQLLPGAQDDARAVAALRGGVEIARGAGDDELLALALWNLVKYCAIFDPPRARPYLDEATAAAERVGGEIAAWVRHVRGLIAFAEGDLEAARAAFSHALALARELGGSLVPMELQWLGHVAFRRGDRSAALALFEEALALFRSTDAWLGILECVRNLGLLRLEEGDPAGAMPLLRESLAAFQESLELPMETHAMRDWSRLILEGLAGATAARASGAADPAGAASRALRLAGAASALLATPAFTLGLEEHVARWLQPAHAILGPDAAAAAWAEGRAMAPDDAIAFALAGGPG